MVASCLFLLVTVAGWYSAQGAEWEGIQAANSWQAIHYEQSPWDPNKIADESDLERTAQFFGCRVKGWEQFCMPYYEALLSRVHEPSLSVQRTNALAQQYRLLYLPSWSPPLILRFYRDQGQINMRFYAWVRPDAPYGNEEPFMTTIPCNNQQWKTFLKQVRAKRFWEISGPQEMPQIKDGCRLELEGLDQGRYHIVHNHLGEDDALGELCMTLLDWVPVEKGKYFLQLQETIGQMLAKKRQASRNSGKP